MQHVSGHEWFKRLQRKRLLVVGAVSMQVVIWGALIDAARFMLVPLCENA